MRILRTVSLAVALSAMTSAAPAFSQTVSTAPVAKETIISHADWTEILQRYVHLNADGVNRFDYSGLRASESDQAKLSAYIDRISSLTLSGLADDERFAAYANLYNALTIRLIVDHDPVSSITKIRPGLFSIGPWKQNIVTLEGEEVSLDHIEHDLLRAQFHDPLVHYSVNCASMGCPNLRPTAWSADTLQEDLESAARDYINHPRGVTIRKDGRLRVSTIYRWFREDFGGSEAGVIEHLLKYANPELAAQIRATPSIAEHVYDWSLNDYSAEGGEQTP